jgi:hypothetical protein
MRPPRLLPLPIVTGALLAAVTYPALALGPLWAGALGLECLALAFAVWARAADDAREQLPRWGWLRRPALAMWIAVAARALLASAAPPPHAASMLRAVEAGGLLWAGLELLAALPAARPYTDLPGPLAAMRPWLPVMLPAAGFLILWRHALAWTGLPWARGAAAALLVLTALLGTLRAFGRLQWTASLRWLAVADGALAALLVAVGTLHPVVTLMLWMATCGGRALMLAGELRGATPRRGALLHRVWRAAAWTAATSLSWPLMLALLSGRMPGPRALAATAVALPVALGAWITVRRFVEAPERRQLQRPDPAHVASHAGALVTLALGPAALLVAWWTGLEAVWPDAVLALVPALLGGGLALSGGQQRVVEPALAGVRRAGHGARTFAREVFRAVIALERRLVEMVAALLRALMLPVRDLHTGDPQEVLLLVGAVALLAILLPFLR